MELPDHTATLAPNAIKPVATLKGHAHGIVALAFSRDRSLLASSAREGLGRIWEISGTPRERATYGDGNSRVNSLAFSPHGRTMIAGSGSLDGKVQLLDVTEKLPQELSKLRGARGAVDAVAYSPDGKYVAAGGEDRMLRVWEPGPAFREDPRNQLAGHEAPIRSLTFAPDSQGVATASRDTTVRVWSLGRIRSWQRAILPHPAEVLCVVWSSDGKLIATACADGIVRLWDSNAVTPKPRAELGSQSAVLHHIAFTPDNRTLVTVTDLLKVTNWDPHAGRRLREWELPFERKPALAMTADGRYLAAGKPDGAIEIYRVAEKRR